MQKIFGLFQAILTALLLCSMLAPTGRAQSRETLDLDGTWNFATDPDKRGENEKWFQPGVNLPAMPLPGYAPTANGTIQVPGIWGNQGYGTETDKVRHNFVGKGWYKRQVEIPQSWSGRRTFLVITGISRYAKVWVNEQFLGEHIGFLSVQQYDITPYAAPGNTATITIQVDSEQRWEVDSMYGCCMIADYMDVAWGGIWGHVFLESRADSWLSDLFVDPNIADSSCEATATLNGKAGLADNARLDVFDKSGRCVAQSAAELSTRLTNGEPLSIKANIPNAKLWTTDSPTLYTAQLSLRKGDEIIDAVESRFGMRQFIIDGPYFLLNGKRLMLRGYGDDHTYPEQMAMPSDKELHLKRLRMIKSYGFNFVRHHSAMMPPEYYDACDEIGFITTAEFPIGYAMFIPETGQRWKANVKPGTSPKPALDTYYREWAAAIKRHRNHPCIMSWVTGNELYDSNPMRVEFQRIARQYDPGRLYVDSDSAAWEILDPKYDRDTLDFYTVPFFEWTNPLDNPDKFKTSRPMKPVISHESGNYVAFSRPNLADQFQHNIKPFWLTAGKAKLEKLGLLQEADEWAEKSERLYSLLHKYNTEAMRKNPFITGYQWWLFQDYWTSSNGIVDHYFRPKSITKEEVLKYNDEIVLLQDGLDRTYRGKDRFDLKLLVSNFSPEPLEGEFVWEVKAGDKSIATRQVSLNRIPQGELAEATKIGLELPETAAPCKLTITAELTAGGKRFVNDWCSWLYPAVIRPAAIPMPVFADETQLAQFQDWGLKPIPEEDPLSINAVYIAGRFDDRLADAIDRGARVVLLNGAGRFLRSHPINYRTTQWKAGDFPENNYCGTFVYDHPATRAMAPDGWCDAGWFHLIEGANKFVLDKTPARPEVIVRALPSMAMVEDDALLFLVGVGKGTLIASGLNHQRAKGRPENEWIVARLLEHAAGLSQPKARWPRPFLSMVYSAPEGCLPGFGRVIFNDGESMTGSSYRENDAPMFICRQNKVGNFIAWQTLPLPKKLSADHVTFVFAGALGYGTQPKTDGFSPWISMARRPFDSMCRKQSW